MAAIALLASMLTAVAVPLVGQRPELLTFDVASVRASSPGGTSATMQRDPGGNFSATNQTLRALITLAYQVPSLQLVGGPGWISTELWDIVAKAGRVISPTPPGQTAPDLLMLRALLEDRFQLVVRREMREMPIYALIVARTDGRLGAQIRRPADDYCQQVRNASTTGTATPPPPRERDCGLRGDGLGGENATFKAGSLSMANFARSLSGQVQRVVIDRTGLTGDWDFELSFTPLRLGPTASAVGSNSPSIFTALEEQLGLKLDATRAPIEVLVIERAERPSKN